MVDYLTFTKQYCWLLPSHYRCLSTGWLSHEPFLFVIYEPFPSIVWLVITGCLLPIHYLLGCALIHARARWSLPPIAAPWWVASGWRRASAAAQGRGTGAARCCSAPGLCGAFPKTPWQTSIFSYIFWWFELVNELAESLGLFEVRRVHQRQHAKHVENHSNSFACQSLASLLFILWSTFFVHENTGNHLKHDQAKIPA